MSLIEGVKTCAICPEITLLWTSDPSSLDAQNCISRGLYGNHRLNYLVTCGLAEWDLWIVEFGCHLLFLLLLLSVGWYCLVLSFKVPCMSQVLLYGSVDQGNSFAQVSVNICIPQAPCVLFALWNNSREWKHNHENLLWDCNSFRIQAEKFLSGDWLEQAYLSQILKYQSLKYLHVEISFQMWQV